MKMLFVAAGTLLHAVILTANLSYAAIDNGYQLSEVSSSWDGTDASRLKAPTVDYDYTYGDESSVTYPLPWAFSFYGASYSQITADANGNIWFTSTGSAHSYNLAATGKGPVIAAWNNDLSSYFYGGVFVQHKTNPERVVIEWQTETYTDEGHYRLNNFEVVLHPDGSIRSDYKGFNPSTGKDFGSGISAGDGTASLNLTATYGNVCSLAGRSFLFAGGRKIAAPKAMESFDGTIYNTTSPPHSITVHNGGTEPLAISAVTLAGDTMFSLVPGGDSCTGMTLAPEQTCSVQAVFSPTDLNLHTGTLTFSSDDPTTPNYAIGLTGTGQYPTLTVTRQDNGSGTVASTPAGIACGAGCAAQFVTGTEVTLTATPDAGSVFTGWAGACSGSGACTITMDASKNVTAYFTLTTVPTVTIGSPKGLVTTSSPQLNYSVSNGTVVVKVDGAVVAKTSGDNLDPLPDGTHTVLVETTSRAGYTGNAESSFTVDTIPPAMMTASPVSCAHNVPVNTKIVFVFSEALDPLSLPAGTIVLSTSGTQVPGSLSLSADRTTVTFSPSVQLAYNRDYTFRFAGNVRDLAGNVTPVDYTATFRTEAAPTDLVGLWHMDGDWSDASGNGNDGTGNNGTTFAAERAEGTFSGQFDGVDDYVTVPSVANLNPGNDSFSLALWVNVASLPTGGHFGSLVAKHDGDMDNGYACVVNSTGNVQCMVDHLGGPAFVVTSPTVIPLNVWRHVAMVLDRTNSILRLYMDGVEVSTTSASGLGAIDPSSPLWFGKYNRTSLGSQENFAGYLDGVSIVRRALLPQEVLNAAGSVPRISITSPGQTVKYKPGESGVATVSASHRVGVVSLACAASGAASGELALSFDPAQTPVDQAFTFQVAADAAPYSEITVACTVYDTDRNVGASSIKLVVADVVPPHVVATSIADQAINVSALTSNITMTFSETLASGTVNGSSVVLETDDGLSTPVAGTATLSADLKTIAFAPSVVLAGGKPYRLVVKSDVTDEVGNRLAADFILHFTTQEAVSLAFTGQGSSSSPVVVASARYAAISIDSSYVVFDGLVVADSISLANNSTLTHYATTTSAVRKLEIRASTVSVDATSKIDVSGKGYLGGYPGTDYTAPGYTLGNTVSGGSGTSNGGGYAGLGGTGNGNYTTNSAYGDMTNPNDLGSGGGGYYDYGPRYRGGSGGGLIRLQATTLTLDGIINAGGTAGGHNFCGAGSGGGIRLDVSALTGSGSINAKGGASVGGGGGGGGRIAIYYDTITLPVENILAAGGKGSSGTNVSFNGGAGTVYLKDNAKAKAALVLNNNGLSTNRSTTVPGGDYISITVKGGATVTMSTAVTTEVPLELVNTSLTVSGALNVPGDLVMTDSQLTVGIALVLRGNLSLTNTAMNVSGGVTIPGTLQMNKGTLIVNSTLNVSNGIILQNQSVLSHYAGTSQSTSLLDITSPSVWVDGTSKIDVSGKGYLGGYPGADYTAPGYTLGNTTTGGSGTSNGGGYAGLGGTGNGNYIVNTAYGDITNPSELGSGGGGYYDYGSRYRGGFGGGLIRLQATTLTLDGSINADGTGGGHNNCGAGSGGGIRLDVSALTGSGSISAKGGTSVSAGGGGGGRIALYYDSMNFPVANVIASGGRGATGTNLSFNGGAGTIYLKDKAKTKAELVLNNSGLSTNRSSSVPGGDYTSVTVKGGAVGSVTSAFTTEQQDFSLTDSELTVNASLSLPGNLNITRGTFNVSGNVTVPGSLVMDKGTLVLKNNLTVTGTITLSNQSMLSHYATQSWGTWSQWKLNINSSSVSIDSTSKIDVTGRGYVGGYPGADYTAPGYTQGNTTVGGSGSFNGGSYGGLGGIGNSNYTVNALYGDQTSPNELGSGGGGYYDYGPRYQGGSGGGFVQVQAGSLALNGSILADGISGGHNYCGAGSGGGIKIVVSSLSGAGTIRAKGGTSVSAGGGGGGRIAIYYDSMTLPLANITAEGGKSGSGSVSSRNGAAGTIYLHQKVMPLAITKSGTGTGLVVSSPTGISCGPTCTTQFTTGSSVTLTATADADSTFSGWSGDCSGTGTCTVTLDAAKNVTASFAVNPQVNLTFSGTGKGTVTILPSGIACNTACSNRFPVGNSLRLRAEPAADSLFTEWSGGACMGSGECQITISGDTFVTALFSLIQPNPVRVMTGGGVTEFPTVQAAYDAAVSGSVIKLMGVDLYEDLNFNRSIEIAVEGGYDSNFNRLPEGETLIHGLMTISGGSVILDRIVIQ